MQQREHKKYGFMFFSFFLTWLFLLFNKFITEGNFFQVKRQPLHDVDWDETCVDDLQRLAEQLQSFDSSEEKSSQKSPVLEEHEHWMKYLS